MDGDSTPRERRVTVAVRVRPLNARERACESARVVSLAYDKRVVVSDPVEAAHGMRARGMPMRSPY